MNRCTYDRYDRKTMYDLLFEESAETALQHPDVFMEAREVHYRDADRPHYEELEGPIHRITDQQTWRAINNLISRITITICVGTKPGRHPVVYPCATFERNASKAINGCL